MYNKIVKALSDSIIPTEPSKEFTKAAQKNAKSIGNVAFTRNKMGMSGGLQAGLGAARSAVQLALRALLELVSELLLE